MTLTSSSSLTSGLVLFSLPRDWYGLRARVSLIVTSYVTCWLPNQSVVGGLGLRVCLPALLGIFAKCDLVISR